MVRWIEVKQSCNVLNAVPNTFVRTVTSEVKTHHICVDCGVSLLMLKQPPKNIAPRSKYGCLKMYVNRIGKRGTLASHRCPSHHRDLLPQASGKKSAPRDSVRNAYSSARANQMSGKVLSVQKKLASVLDGSWPQEAGGLRLGVALSIVPRHLCT